VNVVENSFRIDLATSRDRQAFSRGLALLAAAAAAVVTSSVGISGRSGA
jgi:hypothetical protein